jgi:hypothetical protein
MNILHIRRTIIDNNIIIVSMITLHIHRIIILHIYRMVIDNLKTKTSVLIYGISFSSKGRF